MRKSVEANLLNTSTTFFCRCQLPQVEKLNIREVSVVDTTHGVIKELRQHFGSEGDYPSEFPVRQRWALASLWG